MQAQRDRSRPTRTGGSLRLGSVAGVPVLLSASWWVGAAVIVLLYTPLVGEILPRAGLAMSVLLAVVFTVLLAVSVLLHELGHCVLALRFGIPVRRVRLFLLGGISEVTRTPTKPYQEGVIAAAGPAVSAVLAVITGLGWFTLQPGGAVWLLVAQTCVANLAVAIFNVLPGLPLDGGRIVRALVWRISGRRHSGTAAGVVGAGLVTAALAWWAIVGMAGAADDRWLRLGVCVLMGWFVVSGARAEYAADHRYRWPTGVDFESLVRPVLQLPAESPVSDALVAAAGRGVVLVRADGIAVGLLDQPAAERLATAAPLSPAERAAETVDADTVLLRDEPREDILERVWNTASWQFLVVDGEGRPWGVLRREDVRAACEGRR